MFPGTYCYGHFFLFWYVELVSKVCLHLSVTLRIFTSGVIAVRFIRRPSVDQPIGVLLSARACIPTVPFTQPLIE
jgi:hypothetical protein